jgi:heterodisulfide reductase subunit A-like polyferredoxin
MVFDPIASIGRSAANLSKELALKYARVPGVHILVRGDRCTGCSNCVRKQFCRMNAISVKERRASIDENLCRGCGRCTHLCPRNALAIEVRPPAMVRSTLKKLDDEISKHI